MLQGLARGLKKISGHYLDSVPVAHPIEPAFSVEELPNNSILAPALPERNP